MPVSKRIFPHLTFVDILPANNQHRTIKKSREQQWSKALFGCQQVRIKCDKSMQAIVEYLCYESNSLYNCAVYYGRQIWFKAKKIVSGFDLTFQMKTNKHFNAGYASAMQQTCLNVGEAFKSFKSLLALFNKGELESKPKAPNYRKSGGYYTVSYPKKWLKLVNGLIRFPLGKQTKTWFGISEFFLPFPTNLKWEEIKEVRILPRNGCFYLELVYKIVVELASPDKSNVLGIDHGLNNWLALRFKPRDVFSHRWFAVKKY